MPRAAANPSLPQNDTPAQKAARASQLAQAQTSYVWTVSQPNLPGVPVAASVPASDQPTLEWFWILIWVGVAIVRNQANVGTSGIMGEPDPQASASIAHAQARCDAIETSSKAIASAHQAHRSPGLVGAIETGIATDIAALDYAAHVAILRGHVNELRDLIDTLRSAVPDNAVPASLEAYRALFDILPVPGFAYQFEEDDQFARLRVAGPNAMLIKGITSLPDNFPVTAEHYARVVNGDSLSAALTDGRVFLCDYRELEILEPGTWDGLPKYCYAPLALFAVPPGGEALVPVAIQCGQDSSSNPIFTPDVTADQRWGWEMAKLVVQVADGNYHELFVHLARTHLVMEAVCIATHRHLAQVHPIWGLLVPHCEGSLFINNQAATSLIAANGPIDHIFGGTIASSQLAAATDRLAFDFCAKMPPQDFASRGVDTQSALVDYPYRDDALLVWQAVRDWVHQYVAIYYTDDTAVTGDTELAAWIAALANDGDLKGLGPLMTRDQLIDICTMVIFTASAQHAAVNFPQKDIMAFAPAVTGAGWQAAPSQQSDHARADWLGMMPPLPMALEQLNTLWLLGSVHYRPLGDYRSNDCPYLPWFQDPQIIGADCALARFQSALQQVEDRIAARNARRQYPYPYLLPSLIPTSINI